MSIAFDAISKVIVERYRVFRKRAEIEVRPLTLLAGSNSSGKSSAMHPLLLLKQTLDAPYDPGALLLAGDHVALTSFDEVRTTGESGPVILGLATQGGQHFEASFERHDRHADVSVGIQVSHGKRGKHARLSAGGKWRGRPVKRMRFMLGMERPRSGVVTLPTSTALAVRALEGIIHVPGLRSPPQRDYPVTAIGDAYPGRFDRYVASLVYHWQENNHADLSAVAQDLRELGLTWKVHAERRGDTHVVLKVGRLPAAVRGGAHDLVGLGDVGVGVSQTLPVIMALHAARPGQLVYIEQPELHLHPRAQSRLASLLVRAAKRGVRVVAETHSSLLLLGAQAAIARGELAPDKVALQWFVRDPRTGDAAPMLAELARNGSFGDWPQDFDDVELSAQRAYLDAAESRARRR